MLMLYLTFLKKKNILQIIQSFDIHNLSLEIHKWQELLFKDVGKEPLNLVLYIALHL